MAAGKLHPGADAIAVKGWFGAHKWLILRRISQVGILILFLLGPLAGIWIIKGNLASSLALDVLPLTDPYVLIQSVLAGQRPLETAIIGAIIVAVFYILVGGRAYCSWICPVNIVTDTAAWLRIKLGLKGGATFSRNARFWLLGSTFLLALLSGTIAWELVNPVSILFRGLVFGMGMGWGLILAIFLLDLLVSKRAWCGSLCPVGAFYSLLGHTSLLRVSAAHRENCNDCMDCFVICPEHLVINPALKELPTGTGPIILSSQCTNCGRCIDVCAENVFKFDLRFNNTQTTSVTNKHEVLS
ncbi:MAG: quinol dehydrogenase ferredoxin subunit NapH [Gammaproteobacteria bacterium]|nr:quinol dehydrogenase ferredoxin subunit NapH [Gammaproteobacteria bacterium]MDX2486600.1 quinol dehydrogenase ferredoxin subunit NapH [Gammaproteobacteria bacterium]